MKTGRRNEGKDRNLHFFALHFIAGCGGLFAQRAFIVLIVMESSSLHKVMVDFSAQKQDTDAKI